MLVNDTLVCFACAEQPAFTKFNEFLAHKVRNACSPQADNGHMPSTSLCLLCPLEFARKSSLLLHYSMFHKVHGINQLKCCDSSVPSKAKSKSSRAVIKASKNQPKLQKPARSRIRLVEEVGGDKDVSRVSSLSDDFYFSLQEIEIKEANLAYTKRCLSCLYCTYRCTAIIDLTSHMHRMHPDVVKQNLEKQAHISSDNRHVISMSAYLSKHRTSAQKTAIQTSICHHGASLRCDFCDKHFTNQTYLQRHREKEHIKPKVFECDLCDHVTTAKHKLKVHRKKHLTKEFRCKECDFVSTIKVAIQSHRQVHRTGTYVCEICSKAYKLKDTLEKHMRVHDKSRPYGCTFDGCSLRFKTERMCRGHLKTHYGQINNFPCSECGYAFRHKHHLKRHIENTHRMAFVSTEASPRAREGLETFGLAATSSRADVETPIQSNSVKTSSFNLQDIIIEGERFEVSRQHSRSQPKIQSIILLEANDKNTLLYNQTNADMADDVYQRSQNNSVYMRDTGFTEEVSSSAEASSSGLLGNAMTSSYCLDESHEQATSSIQAGASVEFIVDGSTEQVIFDESREQHVPDALFD